LVPQGALFIVDLTVTSLFTAIRLSVLKNTSLIQRHEIASSVINKLHSNAREISNNFEIFQNFNSEENTKWAQLKELRGFKSPRSCLIPD
jgi:hypothetical protein